MARPPVPEEVKRQLRQESGFGCCKCGRPIIDYHHIIPWEEEEHFRPEDMMVLCPTCHRSHGRIARDLQYKIKENPYNIAHGVANGTLVASHDNRTLLLGGNLFEFAEYCNILRFEGENLLSFKISDSGSLLISAKLYDKNDNLLAEINENEWISHNNFVWDIVSNGPTLKINKRLYQISINIDFSKSPVEISGTLWRKSGKLRITKEKLLIVTPGKKPTEGTFKRSRFSGVVTVLDVHEDEGLKIGCNY